MCLGAALCLLWLSAVCLLCEVDCVQLRFGWGGCVRCVPGAGDTVTFRMEPHLLSVFVTQLHVVPANEGNLDVYINLETIRALSRAGACNREHTFSRQGYKRHVFN